MSDYKFLPNDAAILSFLKAWVNNEILGSNPILNYQVYDFVPWNLPGLENAKDKTTEQYYFVPRERCKPNALTPNRIVTGKRGTWKTNGNLQDIHDKEGKLIGRKQRLVFMDDENEKTPWIMHEYTLCPILDQNKKEIFQEWVVCRIKRSGRANYSKEVNHNGSIVSSNFKGRDANNNAQLTNDEHLQQQQHYIDDQENSEFDVTSMEYAYYNEGSSEIYLGDNLWEPPIY